MKKRIAIVVGEPSADSLGADLIAELKKTYPDATFEGLAGAKMQAQGCVSLYPMSIISVMGFVYVIARLPQILKLKRNLIKHFKTTSPDVFIGVDAPDFNLRLAKSLSKAGIKTVQYVSPTVWAWRQGRVKGIKKTIDLMLTLFPFEKDFYDKHQVSAKFVGHPLADKIPLIVDKPTVREQLNLPTNKKIIALMPGSRGQEIKAMSLPFLEAAKLCLQQNSDVAFVTTASSVAKQKQFQAIVDEIAPELPIHYLQENASDVLMAADAAILTSGTITLEAMLAKTPMVVAYKMSWLTHKILDIMVKSEFFALPNILANKEIIPELLCDEVKPQVIADRVNHYLNDANATDELLNTFTDIHHQLKQNASQIAANEIIKLIGN